MRMRVYVCVCVYVPVRKYLSTLHTLLCSVFLTISFRRNDLLSHVPRVCMSKMGSRKKHTSVICAREIMFVNMHTHTHKHKHNVQGTLFKQFACDDDVTELRESL